MKYTFAFAALAIACIAIASCSNKNRYNDMSQLPEAVQQVVAQNFAGNNVVSSEVETNTFGVDEYEVYLDNGTKVKFEGVEWDEVEVPAGASVPAYFILEPIQTYVATNNPDQTIVKIDREKNGYEVTLSNNVELEFDNNGAFVRID